MDGTVLKLFALVFMTIDHIGAMIPGTPLYFNYIGRMSASIFFFCAVEGYTHTRSKEKYLFRIYIFSQIMSVIDVVLPMLMRYCYPDKRINGISNNVFLEIFGMLFLIYICEKIPKPKRHLKIVITVIVFGVYQILVSTLFYHCFGNDNGMAVILKSLLGIFYNEGAVYVDIVIAIFYAFRDQRKHQVLGYLVWCSIYLFHSVFCIPGHFNHLIYPVSGLEFYRFGTLYSRAFQINYQWMMIFSVPFYILYNGKRGKGLKYLFYLYYPLHIIVLYCISVFLPSPDHLPDHFVR